jgi:homopolymeric O-antigen transport system ATP-binding protein
MGDSIITGENISKRYFIGHRAAKGDDGLRHVLDRAMREPVKWLRSLGGMAATEEFWALRDVNFEIKKGELVGIVGRNGAGKSTLLKILSRITEPTEGRIRIRGRVSSLLEVGTGFHPELTGRENIFLNGAILGMTRHEIKAKFDEIVAFAEVERFIDTPVKRYSSGMYVRLAFAVAAYLEPEILIIDEVLAVGDAAFQKRCLGKMEDVSQREGRTVLLVSHQMPVVLHLCSRCILLQSGSVLQSGPTKEVVDAYLLHAADLTSIELSQRKDRQGIGEARVGAVEYYDPNGEKVQEVFSGGTLVICVHFDVRNAVVLKNCRVTLAVMSNNPRPYFELSTDLVYKSSLQLSGRGHVEFVVPDVPLPGGTYHLNTCIASDGKVVQDLVEDAVKLTVVDGDYYGTGKLYHGGWHRRSVLVRHSCRVIHDAVDADRQLPSLVT